MAPRIAVLALLAACWTSSPPAPRAPAKPRAQTVRVLPTCWTQDFFETWPERVWLWDVTRQCSIDWSEPLEVANCVAVTFDREYERLWLWTYRWWESCVGP